MPKNKRKIRGFFGVKYKNRPTPFTGSGVPYVVQICDEGVFFVHQNGLRKQSVCNGDPQQFREFIKMKAWLKFSKGNPFANPDDSVRFHLQKWNDGNQSVIPGVGSKPHWEPCFIYETEFAARRQKTKFEADGTKWRIVKKTEEVLP